MGRDVVLKIENSSLPFATVLRCHHLSHPTTDMTSAPGEQVFEAYVSSCPCTGRGRIRFLGSTIVTVRWTSSSLYASVCRSSSTICFVFFCDTASADNLTIRMSILSLLFVLMCLLLLALESSNLPRVIVLVLNHTSTIHAAVLFLIVEINLRVTKLLLFPTATAAAV